VPRCDDELVLAYTYEDTSTPRSAPADQQRGCNRRCAVSGELARPSLLPTRWALLRAAPSHLLTEAVMLQPAD